MADSVRYTVLVVDDEPLILTSLQRVLRRRFDVLLAESGQQALDLLRANEVHFLIADQHMPGMTGVELLALAKQESPDTSRLLLTGSADLPGLVAAVNAGEINGFLVKPWDADELLATIEKVGEKRRLLDENRRLTQELLAANAELRQHLAERQRAEALLQESKQRFQILAEVAPVGIFRTDAQGSTEYVNPRWCEISGLSFAEALNNGWLRAVHPDDLESLAATWQQAALAQTVSRAEYRFLHPDGSITWVIGQAVPQRDANGTIVGYIGTITDITKRKRAEDALHEERNKLAKIAATVPGVIYELRLRPDGSVQIPYASPASQDVNGFQPEEIAQDSSRLLASIHPDDLGLVNASVAESARTLSPWRQEFRYQHPTKGAIWLEGHSMPQREADGSTIWYGVFTDITKRKRAGDVLRASEARFRSFVEHGSEAVWRLDIEHPISIRLPEDAQIQLLYQHGYLADHNAMMAQAYGMTDTERFAGARLGHLLPRLSPQNVEILRVFIRSGYRATDVEAREIDRQTHVRYSLTTLRGIVEDGHLTRVWGSKRDITERKAAEDEIRHRAAELAALYDTTHDLATQRDLPALLQTIVERATALLAAPSGAIYLYDATRDDLELTVAKASPAAIGTRLKLGEGMAGRVAQTREVLIVDDYQTWVQRTPQYQDIPVTAVVQVPLLYGGELLGVLGVNEVGAPTRKFTQADARLLALFAGQAASAVHNARLLDETRRYAANLERSVREMTAIHHLSQQVGASLSLDEVVQTALREVAAPVATDAALLFLREGDRLILKGLLANPPGLAEADLPMHRVGECLCGIAVGLKQAVYSGDIRGDARCNWDECKKAGYASFAALPLRSGEEVIGILGLAAKAPRDFSTQADFLNTMAATVGVGVQNALLYAQIQRHAVELEQRVIERTAELEQQYRRQAALAEIELAINQPHELQAALDRIAQATTELLPASGGASVILWDAQAEAFTLSASTIPGQVPNTGAARARRTGGATRWIVDHRQPIVVSDIRDDPFGANRMLPEFGQQAYAGVPLIADAEALGALYALDRRPRQYTPQDLDFMSALANRAAVAITKVRLYATLQAANQALEQRTVQLEAANKELESFSYSVSHDLRAPLRAVSGFAEIIARRHRVSLNEEGRHYVDNIVQASERMGHLIDDLLQYSRLGRTGVRHAAVSLRDVLTPLASDLAARLKEIDGTLIIADDLPTVIGDRTLLSQTFTNLLDNAVTYRRSDVPLRVAITWVAQTSEVSADPSTSSGQALGGFSRRVIVRVRDNGIGIPAEYHEKIFNIFQRLHSDEDYPGTGIGLATVKKAVELLGGSVWVESVVGEGSTFFVQLQI